MKTANNSRLRMPQPNLPIPEQVRKSSLEMPHIPSLLARVSNSMTCLSIRYAALALGLLALSACSSLQGTASSYARQSQPLDSFIKSRPEAAALLRRYPALDQWLQTEFVRPLGPYRLAWDDGPPGGGAMGSHMYSPEHSFVIIRIRHDLPPADQLTGLVYEICNSRGYLRFGELVKRAESHTITRNAFVDGLLDNEIIALRSAGKILPQLMPLSPSERKPLRLYNALLDAPADFSQFAAWRRRHRQGRIGFDVRAFYGKQYDRLVSKNPPGRSPQGRPY